nr:hypothetical protein [Tanacetum cinerariifolium]
MHPVVAVEVVRGRGDVDEGGGDDGVWRGMAAAEVVTVAWRVVAVGCDECCGADDGSGSGCGVGTEMVGGGCGGVISGGGGAWWRVMW